MLGPCRLPYEFIAKSTDDQKGNVSSNDVLDKGYLLSCRDLCGLNYLPQLINSGVMCFKIEGRMKTPEYVATVTRIYRKYIDLALSNKPYKIDDKDIEELAQVFNRGSFSSGHLDSNSNKELVYTKKPNHMGIYVGNISNLKPAKGHVLINLKHSLSLGDTIQFENENSKYTISELMLNGKNIPIAYEKQFVEIGRMKGNLHIGDKIYRVANKELSNIAKSSYEKEHKKIFLDAHITIKKDKPIILDVFTSKNMNKNILFENINVSFSSSEVPVEAKSQPIDKERIISQLNKTNDTIFCFNNIDVDLDDNLFLPSIKVLNELRRNALEEVFIIAQSMLLRKSPKINDIKIENKPKINKNNISVLLNILKQNGNYENLKNINQVYIPLKYFSNKNYEEVISNITNKFNTYIYLPTIIKGNYKNLLQNVINDSIDKFNIKGFVISNLGNGIFIEEMKNIYGNLFEFIGNYTLNAYNHQTEEELKNLGISKLTISPELDKSTIDSITINPILDQELIVYGNIPLMSINYCLLGKTNKCYPTCGVHCRDNKKYYLKDRLGLYFRVVPDNVQTVSTIYNSKTTSLCPTSFNVSSYRIDVLDESIDEINFIVENVLAGKRLEGNDYTNGNLNREI